MTKLTVAQMTTLTAAAGPGVKELVKQISTGAVVHVITSTDRQAWHVSLDGTDARLIRTV